MKLSPALYHTLIRPRWVSNHYIHQQIQTHFDLSERWVLDFGCGTGSSCTLASPDRYLGVDPNGKRIRYANHLFPDYQFQQLDPDHFQHVSHATFDYILMIAVLHHISSPELAGYLRSFRQILKPHGKILIIEPCLFKKSRFNNHFMRLFDNGQYIRNQEDYFRLFQEQGYQVRLIKQYKKLFFYNELFFVATL